MIDNQFFPQVPGTTLIYKAETPDGCEWSKVTATNDTKVITVPGQDPITVRVVVSAVRVAKADYESGATRRMHRSTG